MFFCNDLLNKCNTDGLVCKLFWGHDVTCARPPPQSSAGAGNSCWVQLPDTADEFSLPSTTWLIFM